MENFASHIPNQLLYKINQESNKTKRKTSPTFDINAHISPIIWGILCMKIMSKNILTYILSTRWYNTVWVDQHIHRVYNPIATPQS